MRIAYIGPEWGTSLHRANSLKRLGHELKIIDPWSWLGSSKWTARWLQHMGGVGSSVVLNNHLQAEVSAYSPDIIWIDQGPFLGPRLLKILRKLEVPVINYMIDDPFGPIGRPKFNQYFKALPYYDLVAVVREQNIQEARDLGARNVIRIWRSADEVAHRPREVTYEQRKRFASEVAFIGTWMPERGPFMVEMIHFGVPLSIWGDNWQKAKEWPMIADHWRGPGVYGDDDYAATILSTKVNLGLLSKNNRDMHTTRSLEIPALGGMLCAERSPEHLALYKEGEEAMFWDTPEECAAICRALLADDPKRLQIARRGHERARINNLFNEPVMAGILDEAFKAV